MPLTLAVGERGDASLIRQGCDRAEINVTFHLVHMPGSDALVG
jgi:DNA repair protein RecN (Recombination protein N)